MAADEDRPNPLAEFLETVDPDDPAHTDESLTALSAESLVVGHEAGQELDRRWHEAQAAFADEEVIPLVEQIAAIGGETAPILLRVARLHHQYGDALEAQLSDRPPVVASELLDQLVAILRAIDAGGLAASASTRARIEGAVVALRALDGGDATSLLEGVTSAGDPNEGDPDGHPSEN